MTNPIIIPDANILVYAYDETSSRHESARRWWEYVLSEGQSVGIPEVVVLAFTRLLTHPQICENPLSIQQVRIVVEGWFELSHVRLLRLSGSSLARFYDLLEEAELGGNLCTDAWIALHALEQSGVVVTNDRDFARFAGVKCLNPFQ
jgi:toxin-antitoxin system PIN domain toxin